MLPWPTPVTVYHNTTRGSYSMTIMLRLPSRSRLTKLGKNLTETVSHNALNRASTQHDQSDAGIIHAHEPRRLSRTRVKT